MINAVNERIIEMITMVSASDRDLYEKYLNGQIDEINQKIEYNNTDSTIPILRKKINARAMIIAVHEYENYQQILLSHKRNKR